MRKFCIFMFSLMLSLTAHALGEEFTIVADIPVFSFETPIALKIKVIDKKTNTVAERARVIFEAIPGSSPPFTHNDEFAYYRKFIANNHDDPDVIQYFEYLKTSKVNRRRAYRKIATYQPTTGFHEATYLLDRAPYQIKAFVIDENGDIHNSETVYPHRAHCAYFDVMNIELTKQYLHYIALHSKKDEWDAVNEYRDLLDETLSGTHGLYYMVRGHHGENLSAFEGGLKQLSAQIDNRAKSDTINGVNTLLQVVQKNEDYFGTIDYRYDSEKSGTIIKIWDNTYDKPMTDVIVIIQQNYSIEKELENPSLIALQKPKEGKYHATLSFMPEGKYAQELGGGEYFAKGVNLESITSPTRIFAYYSLGDLEIPGKFITEELNVQH